MNNLINKHLVTSYNKELSTLVFDNNKKWEHGNHQLISDYVQTDIHELFDLILDEKIFDLINEQFDQVFIGELFHVLEYQTLIYNIEKIHQIVNDNGQIFLSLPQNCETKTKESLSKVVSRINRIPALEITKQNEYLSEDIKWVLLTIEYKDTNRTNNDANYDLILNVGHLILQDFKKGKKPAKIKLNKIASQLDVSLSNLVNQVPNLEFAIKHKVLYDILNIEYIDESLYIKAMADYIFINRNAIKHLDANTRMQIQSSVFEFMCSKQLIKDEAQFANQATKIEYIWNNGTNKKLK